MEEVRYCATIMDSSRPAATRMINRPIAAPILALCAVWLCTDVARAQVLPTEPIQLAGGRVVFSGQVAGAISSSHDDGYFNDTDYGSDALRVLRVGLSGGAEINDHLTVLGEIQTDNFDTLRPYALYARIRPSLDYLIDIQIGRIPPTFGAYGRRSYGPDDPLIGYPIVYQYATTLRSDALPATADDLLRVRGRGFRVGFPVGAPGVGRGLPLISSLRWDTGVQVRIGERPISLIAAVTQGTLSNPLVEDDNGGKQVAARLAVRPNAGLVFGLSAATGAYLSDSVQDSLAGQDGAVPKQSAVGVDLEYARGAWLVRSEAILGSWNVPAIAQPSIGENLYARAVIVEGQYKLRAGVYLAGRYDYLGFSRITGTRFDGRPTSWDAPLSRIEAGGGYYLLRNVTLKVTYQHNWRDGGPQRSEGFLATQLSYWF